MEKVNPQKGSDKPKTIDEYILFQPEAIRPLLIAVEDAIRSVLPNAQEGIKWGMPSYWQKHNIIHFAANKEHVGFYIGEKAIEYFSDRLEDYKKTKGAVQFPYSKPLPLELISDIAKWCYETGNHH